LRTTEERVQKQSGLAWEVYVDVRSSWGTQLLEGKLFRRGETSVLVKNIKELLQITNKGSKNVVGK